MQVRFSMYYKHYQDRAGFNQNLRKIKQGFAAASKHGGSSRLKSDQTKTAYFFNRKQQTQE